MNATTTFATTSIKQTEQVIRDIQEQINQLTERLTQKQAQLQTELSLEQAGLSAIAQFQEAVNRIAKADNPEMLQNFLQQMHEITQEAIFRQRQNSQPKLSEAAEPEPTETEPKPPTIPGPTETEFADEEPTEITATDNTIGIVDSFPAIEEPEEQTLPITVAEPLDLDEVNLPYQSLYNYAKELGFQSQKKGRPAQLVLERFIKQEAEKSVQSHKQIIEWIAANKRS